MMIAQLIIGSEIEVIELVLLSYVTLLSAIINFIYLQAIYLICYLRHAFKNKNN